MSPGPVPFQAFTIRANGLADRLLTDVEVMPAFDPASPPNPAPPSQTVKALWDTGATRSVVSPDVAATLTLTPVGVANVQHAGGCGTSPTYLVNFVLPNKFGIMGALVTESPLRIQGFDVLIGMDVITLGDMSISHVSGETCMSFRMPSIGGNDYVQEHRTILRRNVGRNDPCPCGKTQTDGRPVKFKNCCGN